MNVGGIRTWDRRSRVHLHHCIETPAAKPKPTRAIYANPTSS